MDWFWGIIITMDALPNGMADTFTLLNRLFWICNLLRSTGGELTLQLKSQAESENPPK